MRFPLSARGFAKWPLWTYFPVGLALLFAGLVAIGVVMGASDEVGPKGEALRRAPLWILVLMPIGEALVWTVLPTEGFARAFRAPLLGAVCGLLAYMVYHASGGLLSVVSSAWVGAVWGSLYVLMRGRSRWAAFATLVCLRWSFVAYAYVSVGGRGFGP
jgi:hypothetical protein